jgi:MFS family permease
MKNNIRKMYLLNFFVSMQFFAGVIIPFFTIWGGLSLTQIFLLQSFYCLCIVLMEIPSGAIADRFGRKKTIIVAILFNIVGALIYTSKADFYVFMAGEFLWAIAASFFTGSENALVYDTLKKIGKDKKSKAIFSRYESAGLLGMMVGAPAGSLIASMAGLQAPMTYLIVPFSISILVALTIKEPMISKRKNNYLKTLISGTKYFFKHNILKVLAFDMISISLLSYFLFILYQKMLLNAGLDVGYFGFVFSFIVLAQVVIMNNFCRLENFLGSKRRLLLFSSVIAGVSLIIVSLTNMLSIMLICIVLAIGFGSSRSVLFTSYYNKYIPSDKRATVLSSISMVRRLVIAIITPLVGIAADWSLTYTLVAIGLSTIVFALVSRVEEDMLID